MILDSVHCVDFSDLLSALSDQSVDMILADLPYGTTACSWDEVIPFEPMWAAFERVIKRRGAIVLTAAQPFTSRLICSNLGLFRYEWVWDKVRTTGHLNANHRPLRVHESVLVFSPAPACFTPKGAMNYYPQKTAGKPYTVRIRSADKGEVYRGKRSLADSVHVGKRYPVSIVQFPAIKPLFAKGETSLHPTQKPVDLFEYLICTYTQPGDLVVDPCCGSGTTAIAARNTGRYWICGDNGVDKRTGRTWAQVAQERLDTTSLPVPRENFTQNSLWNESEVQS